MKSLRVRLFMTLIAATGALWLIAAAWIYVGARQEVEHVLDTRLQEAARMVASLVASGDVTGKPRVAEPTPVVPGLGGYERQLSCQIWSFDDRLVARSTGAPDEKLSEGGSGFSERVVKGEPWRVYAIEDEAKGVRVLVGDRLGLREKLVADLIKGLLWPAALILPVLGLLIWASVGRGLSPLRRMAHELGRRDAEDMRPVDAGAAPSEIRPLTAALNGLFDKVERARRHEREVTAFAAHELRTPLAGLKTQAQIAAAAQSASVRDHALKQILVAVDRASRLVSQLLALARLDAEAPKPAFVEIALGTALEEAIELSCGAGAGDRVRVEIEAALRSTTVFAPREPLLLLLRNLTENAIQHSERDGSILWRVGGSGSTLELMDEGPGADEEDIPRLTQRFFRGAQQMRSGDGVGLGLAIAAAAAELCDASLSFQNRKDRSGLVAHIAFLPPNLRAASARAA